MRLLKPGSVALSAGVLVATPLGYSFITEGVNGHYKLPGGRWEEEDGRAPPASVQMIEVARRTVCREFLEEVGILLSPDRLDFVGKEDRNGKYGEHEYYLFKALASTREVETRRKRTESNIHPYFLSGMDLLNRRPRVLKQHLEMLQRFNLWPL